MNEMYFLFGSLVFVLLYCVMWDISNIAKSLRIIVEELKKIKKSS